MRLSSLKTISKEINWENYLVKAEPIGNCGTNKPDILPDDLPIFNPNPKDNISIVTLKLVSYWIINKMEVVGTNQTLRCLTLGIKCPHS